MSESTFLRSPAANPLGTATRREFFWRGATMAGLAFLAPSVAGMLTACSSDVNEPGSQATIDLSTNAGALNFCYALAQFQKDMYVRFYSNPFVGELQTETSNMLSFYTANNTVCNTIKPLVPSGRIPDALKYNFTSVNFSDRASSVGALQTVADVCAQGLVGIAPYFTVSDHVTLAAGWATAAASRATTVRAMGGQPAFPGTLPTSADPVTVMAVLEPYYYSTITLLNAGAHA